MKKSSFRGDFVPLPRQSRASLPIAFVTGLVVSLTFAAGCSKGGKKPLGDKKVACTNIHSVYQSKQDLPTWLAACMAAPDENVRCINLVMEEGKDSDCKKLVNSAERTNLVLVLNSLPTTPP